MPEFPKLSNREWDVLKLLLQGKSNKLIASSLHISVRTVEFHLKNIYAKFQVSSRVELILKLGSPTGGFEAEKLGDSTVEQKGELAENRDRLNSRLNWATSFGETVSIIGKELEMKNHLYILVGISMALFTGFGWVTILRYTHWLRPDEIRVWITPLIVIWTISGLAVGLVGKRKGKALRKVILSTLVGTGLSPFTILPLMRIVVMPIGKLAQWVGLIDPSTMSVGIAYRLTMTAILALLLMVGTTVGIGLLLTTIQQPAPKIAESQFSGNGL